MTFDDLEPVVTLASGAVVLQAVYDTLTSAQHAGYCVALDDDGRLLVCPDDLHENAAHILESNSSDVALILDDQTGRVH